MPPQQPPPNPSADTGHMLPAHQEKSSIGPVIGAFIVIALLIFGGLYFWGDYLRREKTPEQLPFISGEADVTLDP